MITFEEQSRWTSTNRINSSGEVPVPQPNGGRDIKRILVVDDRQDYRGARAWVEIAQGYGCTVRSVVGKNSTELFGTLQPLLREQSFHATLLDILFVKEPDGGIRLWQMLAASGLHSNAGQLLVYTKDLRPDIIEFADIWAKGWICFSAVKAHRASKFKEFLKTL